MQQKGFTLIELMLVIALIGVITLMGASAYKQQSDNFKIDKGALQMQQWMQAAQAYYTDCFGTPAAGWPPTTGVLLGTELGCKGMMTTYIFQKDNPWGNAYQISSAGSQFWVLSSVPDKLAAERLTARLPNAGIITSTSPWVVQAQVSVPGTGGGGGSTTNGLLIMSIQSPVQSGTVIAKPACPTSAPNPHIYLNSVAFIGTPFSGNQSPWPNQANQTGPYKQQDWGGTQTGGIIARYQDKGTGWLVTMTTYGRAAVNDPTMTQYWNYATVITTCEGEAQVAPPTPFVTP